MRIYKKDTKIQKETHFLNEKVALVTSIGERAPSHTGKWIWPTASSGGNLIVLYSLEMAITRGQTLANEALKTSPLGR